MDIICIQGSAPGRLVATVSHGARVRQMPVNVLRHPAGGWRVQQTDGSFGPRCHAVGMAVLLEAGEVFAGEEAVAA